MSDNGQRVLLPDCMIGPSEPCDAFQRQTARITELEAELNRMIAARNRDHQQALANGAALAAERGRREAAEAELARMIAARNRDHQQALANGAAAAAERERREAAEWVLKEIRIRLHAAGRRPEECWEMSEIDGHLAQFEHRKD